MVERADLSLFIAKDRDLMSCEFFSTISLNVVLDVLFAALFEIPRNAGERVAETSQVVSDRCA